MNDFYYDLININKKREDRFFDIKNIINKSKEDLGLKENSDGLCKIAANNISCDLDEAGINHYVINTLDLGSHYEHVFVVAIYKTINLNYVLIDPTFIQFVATNNLLLAFKKWPSDVLIETTEGKSLLDNLLEDGVSLVSNDSFSSYLDSLGVKNNDLVLDSLISFNAKMEAGLKKR
jgi:hypothetical protein